MYIIIIYTYRIISSCFPTFSMGDFNFFFWIHLISFIPDSGKMRIAVVIFPVLVLFALPRILKYRHLSLSLSLLRSLSFNIYIFIAFFHHIIVHISFLAIVLFSRGKKKRINFNFPFTFSFSLSFYLSFFLSLHLSFSLSLYLILYLDVANYFTRIPDPAIPYK
jgi:hypothetical protein